LILIQIYVCNKANRNCAFYFNIHVFIFRLCCS